MFCKCFYSWRAGWTHHTCVFLPLRTWESQHRVRAEVGPQLGARSLGPWQSSAGGAPPSLHPWEPQHRAGTEGRSAQATRPEESTGPCGAGAFRCQGPPVLSRAAPLSSAFCFCSGMPWERRGKDGEDFPHLIVKEHKIRPRILEKRFMNAGPFAVSTRVSSFGWANMTCLGMSFD